MGKAVATILKGLIFFVGWAVLVAVLDVDLYPETPAVWRFFAELIPLALLVAFTIVFVLLEMIRKGDVPRAMVPIRRNAAQGAVAGFLIGLVWIETAAVILLLSNQISIVGSSEVSFLWLWIISACINVVTQELLVRGYLYQLVKTRYGLRMAVIVTTLLFTAFHGGIIEVGIMPTINLITMCLFITALYEAEETILAPIMAHAVWNVIGAIVLGGVSLADDYPSLFLAAASDNVLVSGGSYLIEGSVVVAVINIVLMLVFYLIYRKKVRTQKS